MIARQLLCDVVEMKIKIFEMSKTRAQSAEEHLKVKCMLFAITCLLLHHLQIQAEVMVITFHNWFQLPFLIFKIMLFVFSLDFGIKVRQCWST